MNKEEITSTNRSQDLISMENLQSSQWPTVKTPRTDTHTILNAKSSASIFNQSESSIKELVHNAKLSTPLLVSTRRL